MKIHVKKKLYRLMCAKAMKSGRISDAKGGWMPATGHSIGQSVVSGARHERT